MRPSTAGHRMSHASSSASQAANAIATAKLLEKKKEFEAVSALETASGLLVRRIEGLADDCDAMAVAGEVHGQVLEQWPNIFRILGLFLASRDQSASVATTNAEQEPISRGNRLVRIPVEELLPAQQTGT